ncbi:dipeptide/oligopeptide/nickel ABC transporter ATP-binding protein [Nocardioides sp. L-11A]|uniref:ABC transporter ATP-binding protein n=1 Tax=Nocardioides sp. L-11A TaxID=3043848 RepID=UPI00249B14FB|nr:dipeptide/oligopeptide/nickel ABC transporter ATP-binding protein [Nocardioides sp. L-11A]
MTRPDPTDAVVRTVAATRLYQEDAQGIRGVRGLDLHVRPGETVGLSGLSGCGKSTALRLVAGIERPDSGSVLFGGVDVWGTRRSRGRLRPGYVMPVFQDPTSSLDARWPIWRSVTEPLTVGRRLARAERAELAQGLLAEVGLGHLDVHALPSQLSGGQCQRVAIARALAGRPALLVADEPTASLDVTSAAGILHVLRRTAASGTAVVIVSHDRRVLGALCDRTVRMAAGAVVGEVGVVGETDPVRPTGVEAGR